MRTMLWFLALWFASATAAWGQSDGDALNAFRDSVMGKELVLRNFSGATMVAAVWSGTSLQLDVPQWHMFAALQTKTVEMDGNEVKLQCERRVLKWNEQKQLAAYDPAEQIEIDIALRGADPAQVLPQVRDQLFYSSFEDALNGVPDLLKAMVPGNVIAPLPNPAAVAPPPSCDCTERDTEACRNQKSYAGLAPPKVLHTVDPRFTREARKRRLSGTVITAFVVDASGRITDIWVTQPLASGLTDQSVYALSNYVFRPGTCHAQPVSVPLWVQTRFQIF